jgi:DNA-binding transcriptional ArsR family regulator
MFAAGTSGLRATLKKKTETFGNGLRIILVNTKMIPMAAIFEALAAPRRREILKLVWDTERSAGDIHRAIPEVSFGAVSQHLGVLESAGLVARRKAGRFHYYAARRKELGHLGKWLETMWDEALSDLKRHAEAEEKSRSRRRGGKR